MAIRTLTKSYAPVNKEIRYLNKSFSDFRQNLIDFAKVYFPTTYSDFNEASPGMMFIEMASYVGDVLGYYIDTNFRESLLEYAEEEDSIISIAQSFGYKPKPATAATGEVELYQLCPAKGIADQYAPDDKYYLRIAPNALFTSDQFSRVYFRTINVVDFNDPTDREITVYSADANNIPLTYLIRKKARVVAGTVKTYTATFGVPEKFSKIVLPDIDVLDIISVVDVNGNKWYQVDYLAQDLVFDESINTMPMSTDAFSVPPTYNLNIKRVPRRFVTRYNTNFQLELHFGSGVVEDSDESVSLEPKKIANTEYQTFLVSTPLDPSDFLSTRSYGLSPSNTQLSITYTVGGGLESNVPSNSLNKIVTISPLNDTSAFNAQELLLWRGVLDSIAVNNEIPATGGKDKDSVEEIRQNAMAFFNSQNRLVTYEDYVARTYAMPPKYGGVSKVFVNKDDQINNILRETTQTAPINGIYVQDNPGTGVINLYLLGYNKYKKLTTLNPQTKENLKLYLDQYRMLTDEIRIMDGFVVNIGVDFKVLVYKNYNLNEVLARCISSVSDFFNIDRWQMNQPIIMNDLYLTLASVDGVQSVLNVDLFNKYRYKDGSDYEDFIYDVQAATYNGIVYPSLDPSIFEVRYPERDIIGNAIQ